MERVERINEIKWTFPTESLEVVRACHLCAGASFVEVAQSDRYGFPQRIVVCASCGLGFLSPRLSHDEYVEFYRAVYRPLVSAYHGQTIDAESLQAEQQHYGAGLVEFLRWSIPTRPRSILDVGGSTGIVARELVMAFGSAATILDPAPDELAVAESLGLEVMAGFIEDAELGERVFDLVLICRTIDHLLDVRASLAAVRDVLAPDGFLFVDILEFRRQVISLGSIEQVAKIDHPFYFTRASALSLFETAGFAPVAERASTTGQWGFLLRRAEPKALDLDALRGDANDTLSDIWRPPL